MDTWTGQVESDRHSKIGGNDNAPRPSAGNILSDTRRASRYHLLFVVVIGWDTTPEVRSPGVEICSVRWRDGCVYDYLGWLLWIPVDLLYYACRRMSVIATPFVHVLYLRVNGNFSRCKSLSSLVHVDSLFH